MNLLLKSIFRILILLATGTINGQLNIAVNGLRILNSSVQSEQIELIYDCVKSFPNNTQVAIALINEGKVDYFGIERKNDTIVNIENSFSIFEIGSISKTFTSTILANLVIEGKVNLNDNINIHLDTSINSAEGITLFSLSNHTSGLPRLPTNLNFLIVDPNNPYKDYNEQMLLENLSEQLNGSQSTPGKYEYSNLGAGLLGYITTIIEGKSYEELLHHYIFSKYQMHNSSTIRSDFTDQLVFGLNAAGQKTSNWDFNVLVGAGGIYSNVVDLANFVLAHFNPENKELALTRVPTFTLNQNMDIALGWHIIKSKSNDHLVWHNGGTGGYSSSMAFNTETKDAIVILSNVSAFHTYKGNIDKLCFELMKTFN